ncbi:MAG: hypothetical protein IJ334_13310, partial [Clostridia bacterium]|nr:hypothetical protein [Clostridia bacterium]
VSGAFLPLSGAGFQRGSDFFKLRCIADEVVSGVIQFLQAVGGIRTVFLYYIYITFYPIPCRFFYAVL